MRYAMARCNQHRKDLAYRIYISDCEKLMCDLLTKMMGGKEGVNCRYIDFVEAKPIKQRKDARGETEIIASIRKKITQMNQKEVKYGDDNSNC